MKRTVLETIGTPLVRIDSPPGATVAAKLESFNPGGSAKDRPALAMVEAAERDGELEPGDRLVEATSGNTGIGLAIVAAVKGYDLTLVMPSSKSEERRRLLRAYGASIELVDGDISDARDRADRLEATSGAVQLRQFENPANAEAHYRTTAPELLAALDGRPVAAFVATVGTGGTITGVARRLREVHPAVRVVAVEPAENAVLSTGEPGEDGFQGMGPGFVPPLLDRDLLDDVVTVSLSTAEAACRRLAREEGILVGQSSGAAAVAARRVARSMVEGTVTEAAGGGDEGGDGDDDDDDVGPLVVTIFPDSGERYLSVGTFDGS